MTYVEILLTELFIAFLDHLDISPLLRLIVNVVPTRCTNFSSDSIDCCVRKGFMTGILCLDGDDPNSKLLELAHDPRGDVSDCCAEDNSCESD